MSEVTTAEWSAEDTLHSKTSWCMSDWRSLAAEPVERLGDAVLGAGLGDAIPGDGTLRRGVVARWVASGWRLQVLPKEEKRQTTSFITIARG
jgi:hypothetical protein